MRKRRLLILWAFLSHFFILFGFAHAGAFIGLIEIIYFPYITNAHFTLFLQQSHGSYLPTVGLFGLIGNIALLIAVLMKPTIAKTVAYYIGLAAYWISIAYLWYDSTFLGNTQFSTFFCIPLLLITAQPLLRKRVEVLNGWLKN